MHLSVLSLRGLGLAICGTLDFSEEFLVEIPTQRLKKWVKYPHLSIVLWPTVYQCYPISG